MTSLRLSPKTDAPLAGKVQGEHMYLFLQAYKMDSLPFKC
jgi:hypothetical protein